MSISRGSKPRPRFSSDVYYPFLHRSNLDPASTLASAIATGSALASATGSALTSAPPPLHLLSI